MIRLDEVMRVGLPDGISVLRRRDGDLASSLRVEGRMSGAGRRLSAQQEEGPRPEPKHADTLILDSQPLEL